MSTQHTPGPAHPIPWVATDDGYITSGNDYVAIFGAEEWTHDEKTGEAPPWMLQDAAFIVLAVNSHDALLEAARVTEAKLEEVYLADAGEHSDLPDVSPVLAQLRAAIAAAEGRTT